MTKWSRLCQMLGIPYPILLGGMGGAGSPELVAAVSEAGGLGVLGAADCSADELREKIDEVRWRTDKPFGVNTLQPASVRRQSRSGMPVPGKEQYQTVVDRFLAEEGLHPPDPEQHARLRGLGRKSGEGPQLFSQDFFDAQMRVILEKRVPVYVSGLGDPGDWVDLLHAADIKIIAVVGTPGHAHKVAASGVDAIIAQGSEAGGHSGPIGTISLVPQVVDAVGDIPVIAAGGIADGRGVAAALMLGAAGVSIGSLFLATHEAALEAFQKEAIIEANAEATTVSLAWTGKPARVLRGKWTDIWKDAAIEPLPMPFQQHLSWPVMAAALLAKRKDIVPGVAGQGVGLIRDIRPAGDRVRLLIEEAAAAFRSADIARLRAQATVSDA